MTIGWAVDTMIQKRPKCLPFVGEENASGNTDIIQSLCIEKEEKKKKLKSCWENNAFICKSPELNSPGKHAHIFSPGNWVNVHSLTQQIFVKQLHMPVFIYGF